MSVQPIPLEVEGEEGNTPELGSAVVIELFPQKRPVPTHAELLAKAYPEHYRVFGEATWLISIERSVFGDEKPLIDDALDLSVLQAPFTPEPPPPLEVNAVPAMLLVTNLDDWDHERELWEQTTGLHVMEVEAARGTSKAGAVSIVTPVLNAHSATFFAIAGSLALGVFAVGMNVEGWNLLELLPF